MLFNKECFVDRLALWLLQAIRPDLVAGRLVPHHVTFRSIHCCQVGISNS